MAKLLLTLQGVALREVLLSEEETTIGRRSRNRIVLDTLGVSGEHAVVRRCGADFYIEDLGSTNGTLVNGQPARKRLLHAGDSIEIGEYRLKFLADSDGESRPGSTDRETSRSLATSPFDPAPNTIQIPRAGGPAEAPVPDGPRLRILSGANAGREFRIRKLLTRLGRPGHETAVITRRPTGYFIEHHRGDAFPKVNWVRIGKSARQLADRDVIELAGVTIEFLDAEHSTAPAPHPQLPPHAVAAAAKTSLSRPMVTQTAPAPTRSSPGEEGRAADRLAKMPAVNPQIQAAAKTERSSPEVTTNRLRSLLTIGRRRRAVPQPGPRPNPGARIFFEELRMTVQAGLTNELWKWLLDAGWREITHRPDRRRYCDVPTECVYELFECAAEDRLDVLDLCVARAQEGRMHALAPAAESRR